MRAFSNAGRGFRVSLVPQVLPAGLAGPAREIVREGFAGVPEAEHWERDWRADHALKEAGIEAGCRLRVAVGRLPAAPADRARPGNRARPSAPRRADQPSRSPGHRMAGASGRGLWRRGRVHDPRPRVPRAACDPDRGDRSRPGDVLAGRLCQFSPPARRTLGGRGAGCGAVRSASCKRGGLDPSGGKGSSDPEHGKGSPAHRDARRAAAAAGAPGSVEYEARPSRGRAVGKAGDRGREHRLRIRRSSDRGGILLPHRAGRPGRDHRPQRNREDHARPGC